MAIHAKDSLVTDDDRTLHLRTWDSENSERVIVVVHGLGEHSGWYQEFGERMVGQGAAVLAYDQHGHGKSPGRRGDAPSLDRLIQDINCAVERAKADYPDTEIVLLGHSLGGHLVLRYLLEKDTGPVSRAIVTNPMILPRNPPTKPQAFAAWLTAKLIPHWRVSADQEPTQLTQDTEVLRELANDPLVHEKLSIGIGGALMSSGHQILETATSLDCDLLLLVGEDDGLCDRESTNEFAELATERCCKHTFKNLRHNLLLEVDRDQVYQELTTWLAKGKA